MSELCVGPSVVDASAIHLPSGDHDGPTNSSGSRVICATFLPSPSMTYTWRRPLRFDWKATRFPSGEGLGYELTTFVSRRTPGARAGETAPAAREASARRRSIKPSIAVQPDAPAAIPARG